MSAGEPLRIVVAGMVAAVPGHGGAAWAVLQWVLGLRALGHDVLLVEPLPDPAPSPSQRAAFADVVRSAGLHARAAMVGTDRTAAGLPYREVEAFVTGADVAVDIAGMLRATELLEPVPTRVYLDLDPAFTQLWQATCGIDMRLEGHTHFITVGLDVGRDGCPLPTCGVGWLPTLPPVVLDAWPTADVLRRGGLTTVANWRGYGSIEHGGVHYGQKAHSWRPLLDLPRRAPVPLQPALAIDAGETEDLAALRAHGWDLLDPGAVAGTVDAYHDFVQGSWGELGVAKSGYVHSGCAWFSDRSVCYLASGRPVVAQDTGFSRHLPTGAGLLAFTSVEEAAEAVDDVRGDYGRHRSAARAIAEECFDSRRVLTRVLEAVR